MCKNKELMRAVKYEYLEKVVCIPIMDLSEKMIDIDYDRTPLHSAATWGYLEIVKILIACGADVNAKDNNNETPLHSAVSGNNLETVKLLISQGADVNAKDNDNWTPLHSAVSRNNLETVKFLISNGAAVSGNNLETVKLLISQGADVNAKDNDNWTPLHSAVSRNNLETVKFLISNGADVNAKTNDNRTPLDIAMVEGNLEILEYLKSILKKVTINFDLKHLNIPDFNHESLETRIIKLEKKMSKLSGEIDICKARGFRC